MQDGLFRYLPPGYAAGFTTRRTAPDGLPAAAAIRALAALLGAARAETVRGVQLHGSVSLVAGTPPVRDGNFVLANSLTNQVTLVTIQK